MNRVKPHLEGVIFDMDGTILDTEQIWEDATFDLLAAHGIQKHTLSAREEELFEQMIGSGLDKAVEIMKDGFQIPRLTHEEIKREILARVNAKFAHDVKFIHGFEAFHKNLMLAGIPSSVATNCDPVTLKGLSDKMKFVEFFGQNVYCVADVNNKPKPDPALFLHAAEKIKANPTKCIVFEDSLWGFKAALSAGMKCIGIKNRNNKDLLAEHTQGFVESYTAAEEEIIKVVDAYLRT